MAVLMGNMVINDQVSEVITCMLDNTCFFLVFHGMDFQSFRSLTGARSEGFVYCDRYATIWLGIIDDVHSFMYMIKIYESYSQLRDSDLLWPIMNYWIIIGHTECHSHTAGLGGLLALCPGEDYGADGEHELSPLWCASCLADWGDFSQLGLRWQGTRSIFSGSQPDAGYVAGYLQQFLSLARALYASWTVARQLAGRYEENHLKEFQERIE